MQPSFDDELLTFIIRWRVFFTVMIVERCDLNDNARKVLFVRFFALSRGQNSQRIRRFFFGGFGGFAVCIHFGQLQQTEQIQAYFLVIFISTIGLL